ncbi:hypothetical protein N7462_003318 [Penicillium macrosclerotiorum]|uniref:uncharacterized protein n=1 Tax=Penicillium macrosclerotiorum TaxID=303699 RepID=UPI002546F19F|nr:uncharacterized protein N7462_003318 [Penicillium macrosclerotiorum]KAJ5688926.1 hypothetical protein N7462_003318 [Penicillium macrosclerotiorum]
MIDANEDHSDRGYQNQLGVLEWFLYHVRTDTLRDKSARTLQVRETYFACFFSTPEKKIRPRPSNAFKPGLEVDSGAMAVEKEDPAPNDHWQAFPQGRYKRRELTMSRWLRGQKE